MIWHNSALPAFKLHVQTSCILRFIGDQKEENDHGHDQKEKNQLGEVSSVVRGFSFVIYKTCLKCGLLENYIILFIDQVMAERMT